MERLLSWYRTLINVQWFPRPIHSFIERLGMRAYIRYLFANKHYRLAPYRIRVTKDIAFTLMLDWHNYTDAGFVMYRVWEEDNVQFIIKNLPPDEAFVDCGANVGFFTVLAGVLQRSRNAYAPILAIEPSARNVAVLHENLKANRLEEGVIVAPVAVGAAPGNVSFIQRTLDSGSGTTSGFLGTNDPVVEYALERSSVPQQTLTQLCESHGIARCGIVKVDVQGSELEVVKGAEQLLKEKRIRYLIIEHNDRMYGDTLPQYLAQLGYVAHNISPKGDFARLQTGERMRDKTDYLYCVPEVSPTSMREK